MKLGLGLGAGSGDGTGAGLGSGGGTGDGTGDGAGKGDGTGNGFGEGKGAGLGLGNGALMQAPVLTNIESPPPVRQLSNGRVTGLRLLHEGPLRQLLLEQLINNARPVIGSTKHGSLQHTVRLDTTTPLHPIDP